MAYSDDEGEPMLTHVNEYYFLDENDEPICISELPVKWDEKESVDGKVKEIFLRGDADNGLQKIHKQVKAWGFDLSLPKPEISVLTVKNEWFKLQKPRKSFQQLVRSALITVHCLHLLKRKPDLSGKALWENISKTFSTYDPKPSENDLVDQIGIISEAVRRDENLEKSDVLVTFLKKKPRKKKLPEEDVKESTFIVYDDIVDGDDSIEEVAEDGSDDEEEDGFDSVCCLCDNGGELLCCEGRCLRSFHATREAGSDSNCKSLGYSDEEVDRIQNFFCKNCKYNQHQCYACGKLGSSDKLSGAEVFQCLIATCGHFYHPHCVAKLLYPENETERGQLREKIASGGQFTCPMHLCHVCKRGENKDEVDLQFAVCRRCPKSYHRKCLPREISFEEDEGGNILQRAWEELLPNERILIYCLDHEIDGDLCTPSRDHIKFPGVEKKKKAEVALSIEKKKTISSEDAGRNLSVAKKNTEVKKLLPASKTVNFSSKTKEKRVSPPAPVRKLKPLASGKKTLNKSASTKITASATSENRPTLGERLFALMNKDVNADEEEQGSEQEATQIGESVLDETDDSFSLDADSVQRIISMMEEVESSVTLEKVESNVKVATNAYSSKFMDKSITLGKVEAYIEAIRAALQKLEEGGSMEDAKSVCEPRFLNQIMKWRDKLKVYLAPFLYGMRYTSFGRHFTKVDKLKAIADKLRWYVQDGDMVIDFCCGSNDFSCLMKEAMDDMGKSCSFKNYDLYPPKNDFSFEKRDWMTVKPKELPPGSKLIMGLNPPFGANARLANQFIDKALQFKPKLFILIVPRETERLDSNNKKLPYDLVWEDDELLSGKSFYLPGSIDVNDKQMDDWNVSTAPLYLWSHPEWTSKHNSIAQQHGHTTKIHDGPEFNEILDVDMEISDHSPERLAETLVLPDEHEQSQQEEAKVSVSLKGGPSGADDTKIQAQPQKTKPHEGSKSSKQGKGGKRGRGTEETREDDKSSGKRAATLHSSPGGKSFGGNSSKSKSKEKHRRPSNKRIPDSKPIRYNNEEQHLQRFAGSEEDTRRRYQMNGGPSSGYGPRTVPNEQFIAYPRETDASGYRANLGESDYRRDAYMREQIHRYGQPEPFPSAGVPAYPSSYPQHVPPAANLSHTWASTSTMQRYAPRLDELNHAMVNPPAPVGAPGMYNPRAQPRPVFRSETSGFAAGPYRPFSANGSSGWLNE